MAPSSAKRRSARKREPTSRQRANQAAANKETPTRPNKRRKTAPPRPDPDVEPDADDTAEEEEEEENQEDINTLTHAADEVIPVLAETAETVNVAIEHPATNESTIQAYAKIAGKRWTYFVTDTVIRIGRSPDKKSQQPQGEDDFAHIDLGPNKMVSRTHAKVVFEPDDMTWYVTVLGRNGLRVNGVLLKGSTKALSSGDVVEVHGTEMIFVLPSVPAVVQEQYILRLSQQDVKSEETQGQSLPHAHPDTQQNFQAPKHISPYAQMDSNGQPSLPEQDVPLPQTTPNKQVLSAPYLRQNMTQNQQQVHSTPQRGNQVLASEGDENRVDYSSDSAKHIKPPMSYATLIAQAILSGPDEKSSLNNIYEWIKKNFSYYRHIDQSWQNSIRHNLSLSQYFLRCARDGNEPGKGGLWYIDPKKKEELRKQGLKMTSRGGARQSSNPSSPAPKRSPKKRTPPKRATPRAESNSKSTKSAKASNIPEDPFRTENQTPSRAPRSSLLAQSAAALPQLSDDTSPLPNRSTMLSQATAGGSPPTLPSSAAYLDDPSQSFGSLYTPAPQRHEPRMTAPSTAKLPSQYLPQSSPAPFWKLTSAVGDTPHQLPDTSPLKIGDGDGAMAAGARRGGAIGKQPLPPILQSSSPPPGGVANGSPTRGRVPNHAAALAPPPPPPAFGSEGKRAAAAGGDEARKSGGPVGLGVTMPAKPAAPSVPEKKQEEEDDDGDERIDLMGGFQPIGAKVS